jgi:glycerophosphoryl diester phosphodiesterase
MTSDPGPTRKIVIGHRGAPACAPENTRPSFDLAVQQGADCIELDIHVSRDGALVCLHDRSLERTTNVRDVFPDRSREETDGSLGQHWFVHDFTLSELQTLECGPTFPTGPAVVRIPTFAEVLDWAAGRTTILAELKDPEIYESLGIDLLSLFDAAVRRHVADRRTAFITVQSFHEPTVRRAGNLYRGRLPVTLLREAPDAIACAEPDRLADIARFATGLGPEKSSLIECPQLVSRAHAAGLRVTPWTFRASSPGAFETVRAEIAYYLSDLDVDGIITDNPDQAAGRV